MRKNCSQIPDLVRFQFKFSKQSSFLYNLTPVSRKCFFPWPTVIPVCSPFVLDLDCTRDKVLEMMCGQRKETKWIFQTPFVPGENSQTRTESEQFRASEKFLHQSQFGHTLLFFFRSCTASTIPSIQPAWEEGDELKFRFALYSTHEWPKRDYRNHSNFPHGKFLFSQ